MTKTTEPVLEAMLHYWGGRCPDFDDTCPQCQAWAAYDALATLSAENERLRGALRDVTDYGDLAAVRIARAALGETK